jgi:hypothetical protein
LQGLAWPFVELASHFVQMGLRVHRQVGAREVLSQQAIGVLIRSALPRALRIAKINVDVGRAGTDAAPTSPAMPSLGYRLTDRQLAAAVTYIRNNWGNAASAVTADTVRALRDRVANPSLQAISR